MVRPICIICVALISTAQLFAQQPGGRQNILSLISETEAGSIPYGVYVHDDLAFITNNDDLLIFGISDVSNPVSLSSISLEVTFGLAVNNNTVFTVGEAGLTIIDIHDPAKPEMRGHLSLRGSGQGIWIENGLAFIATSSGLEIIDISNPERPSAVSHCSEGPSRSVAVVDGIAFVANRLNGLEIIDVSDPAEPEKLSTVPGTGVAWNIHIDEDYLFLGRHQVGLDIFDISDRQHPLLLGNFNDGDGGEALSVWGEKDVLYVADNFGVEVLDIRDPAHPKQLAEMGDLGCTHDIVVKGNRIFIASAAKGLLILEFDPE